MAAGGVTLGGGVLVSVGDGEIAGVNDAAIISTSVDVGIGVGGLTTSTSPG